MPYRRVCCDAVTRLLVVAALLGAAALFLRSYSQQGRRVEVASVLRASQAIFHTARSRVGTNPVFRDQTEGSPGKQLIAPAYKKATIIEEATPT